MGISLQNAMKLGKLGECEIVAGHNGLHKIIENITIMEVPNIVQWLKGKELLLTSLFAIKDDTDAKNLLIKKLYDAGATALAIKPLHALKSIPEEIIKTANELDFPVIKIPDHIKYLDIISPVMHAIFNERVVLQEDLEQATNILNEISLNSKGIDIFIDTLGYLTKNIITVESQFSFIETPDPKLAISTLTDEEINELTIIKRPMYYSRKYGDEYVPCIVAPIIVDKRLFGSITCWGINSDHLPIDLAILEKASSLLSLEFLRIKVKHDMEQQYKNDFIRELLFNESINERDLIEWGEKYQLFNNKKYVCMLLKELEVKSNVESVMKRSEVDYVLNKKWPNIIVGYVRELTCIIMPFRESVEQTLKQQSRSIYEYLKYHWRSRFEAHMGVGRVHNGIQGIRNSYLQAEQALKLSTIAKKFGDITYYDDLGVSLLLTQLAGSKEFIDFYDETVGKLVVHDTNNVLIKTLKTYFQYNENLKNTSAALFIHVNTLKYRISRIETITGCYLHESEGRTRLYLGLKMYDMTKFNNS